MGCFPACFGQWRHKQAMNKAQYQCLSPGHELQESVTLLPATTESLEEEEIVNPMKLVLKSEPECEEQMNESKGKKAVLNHSIHVNDKLVENENGEDEKKTDEGKDDGPDPGSSSRILKSHGLEVFMISDKECVAHVQEELSSESLFSLSIDSRKHFAAEMGDREVNSPLKKPSKTFQLLGNTPLLKYDEEDKENVTLKPTSDHDDDDQFKKKDRETAVDTSLSSWLVESDKSPESEKNYGDRRILAAISPPAERKQLKETSSAGSTPCCSGDDDQLSIGTVGRYWQAARPRRAGAGDGLRQSVNCMNTAT